MARSLSQQFAEHEIKDAERFDALEKKIDLLATKEDLKPILEAWVTIRNGRNGIMWFAAFIIAVGGAIMAVKGIFK